MRRTRLFDTSFELILLLAIVAVGVLLRVKTHHHLIYNVSDGVDYIFGALKVLEGRYDGRFDRKGPFFQLLLMINYMIFGPGFKSSIFVPLFFGSITPILLFLLGKHFFDSKTGLIAALLGSLNPQLINLSCLVLRETTSLALILVVIFAAHYALTIQSKKRSLIASILPGLLSGLLILTREEMIFVIPPAYITYIFFYERKRLDFILRTAFFLITLILIITPWLRYSSTRFGDPFYSWTFYFPKGYQGEGSAPGAGPPAQVWSLASLFEALSAIIFGVWKELTEFPANLTLLGLSFLSIGIMFTIKKRAVWIIYTIIGFDLLILSPEMSVGWAVRKPAATYYWNDVSRIIFPALMPVNVIVAYGVRRFIPFLSDLKGSEVVPFKLTPSLVKRLTILCLIIFGAIAYIPPYNLNLEFNYNETVRPFRKSAEYLNSIGTKEGVFTMHPELLAKYYQGPIYQLPEKGGFEHILEGAKNKGVKYLVIEKTCVSSLELVHLYWNSVYPEWGTIPPQFVQVSGTGNLEYGVYFIQT